MAGCRYQLSILQSDLARRTVRRREGMRRRPSHLRKTASIFAASSVSAMRCARPARSQ